MTTQHDKVKRWRPKFSVRTLAILLTLVCVYLACWGPTKTRGRAQVEKVAKLWSADSSAIAPLIVAVEGTKFVARVQVRQRRYYFWFFGYVAKLPYEREVPPQPLVKKSATSAQFLYRNSSVP